MSTSVSKKFALIKGLFDKGKYEEAVQRINEIERDQTLVPEEMLKIQGYKSLIFNGLGQFERALKIVEELFCHKRGTEAV